MRLRVRFRPLARRDLLEQILYLAEGAGAKMAARYFDRSNVDLQLRRLCRPAAGSRASPKLQPRPKAAFGRACLNTIVASISMKTLYGTNPSARGARIVQQQQADD